MNRFIVGPVWSFRGITKLSQTGEDLRDSSVQFRTLIGLATAWRFLPLKDWHIDNHECS